MKQLPVCLLLTTALFASLPHTLFAQEDAGGSEALKMAAIEALMVAPPQRALPVLQRLLASDNSDELKARALFIVGQIQLPEAHEILLDYARNADGELQMEAIRTIGISGNQELTAQLDDIYAAGGPHVREAVLHAYLIAGDEASVFEIAQNASSDEEFELAVHQLGIMGASAELAQLRDRPGASESLIQAYAIAGDTESLLVIARDNSDPERQMAALQGLGIAGGADATTGLLDVYKGTDNYQVKEAVMHALMISGDDTAVLELFKTAQNDQEKADLLRTLVIMDSDAAIEAIDAALASDDS